MVDRYGNPVLTPNVAGTLARIRPTFEACFVVSNQPRIARGEITAVNTLRLWGARAVREFGLDEFNTGDYIGAIEARARSEKICQVRYPNDNGDFSSDRTIRQYADEVWRAVPVRV